MKEMKLLKKFLDSLLRRQQKNLEESMERREFIFDSLDLFYHKLHKISLN